MSTPMHASPHRRTAAAPPVRRREPPVGPAAHALLTLQSRAGNRATLQAVQRARATAASVASTASTERETPSTGPASPRSGRSRTSVDRTAEDRATEARTSTDRTSADRTSTEADDPAPAEAVPAATRRARAQAVKGMEDAKPLADIPDTAVRYGQLPTNAGVSQYASAQQNSGLSHEIAHSGMAAGAENLLVDALGAAVGGIGARKAAKDIAGTPEGAPAHAPHKSLRVKAMDSLMSTASSVADIFTVARETLKAGSLADAAAVAEASGAVSAVTAVAKAGRAGRRVRLTTRKYRAMRGFQLPEPTGADERERLRAAERTARWALRDAEWLRDLAAWRDEETAAAAVNSVEEALRNLAAAAGAVRDAENRDTELAALSSVRDIGIKKQKFKLGKQALTLGGEGLKGAAGAMTIAAAATAGLASNPAGWALAGSAAGVILAGAGWKTYRAGAKRYNEVRHPERFAEEGEEHAEPVSREEALAYSLKFWKKAKNGEREHAARRLYALAAGPGVAGSEHTSAEMRRHAREFLEVLKAGPEQQRLSREAWEASLDDEARKAYWIKEITTQLSSS
ncbi:MULTISPECIES: hypothetical protein [Streptomyces]|uniref:DUF4231 domain-containing protein n=1 Tax=Streptomyces evansiae TaxID=3075535 RepID=A0ABU2RE24_9ACTN|nr:MULTISPECIES: hypothetical protein [unclassified Streptomyces]MDT0413579.1 hypothetical protein [Streptomyces sp. DSM 41979]SCE58622.1 hypothetical protein GA0115252_17242 [Streptomyces sp. DfronAA-171]